MRKCNECPFLSEGDTCGLSGYNVEREELCMYIYFKRLQLTKRGAEKVLHYHQKWRRGCNITMLSPTLVGKAIDTAIRSLRQSDNNEKKNNITESSNKAE